MRRACLDSPSEDRQWPVAFVFTEDLLKVFPEAKMKAVLVGSADVEDRCAECLQRCSILQHQIHVIAEQTYQAEREHDCDDEEEQQMELSSTRTHVLTLVIERIDLM